MRRPWTIGGAGAARRPARGVERLEGRVMLTTIYVDSSAPGGGTHDGSSWQKAYADLQPALAAAGPGDQIRVADGRYRPATTSNRDASFQLKNGVGLFGGYAGYGAADPDARDVAGRPSVLAGDIPGSGPLDGRSYHVVAAGAAVDGSAVLDGFVITQGFANGAVGSAAARGAGMLCLGAPTIAACTFVDNYARDGGGAMYLGGAAAAPAMARCSFVQNRTDGLGGGIAAETSAAPRLTHCRFDGNVAAEGGGMFNGAGTAPVLAGCAFVGNAAVGFLTPLGPVGGGRCTTARRT